MFTLKRRLLAVTVLTVLALAPVVPASAGSNGQHIQLWENTNVGIDCIQGYNQNMVWSNACWAAPGGAGTISQFVPHWWKYTTYHDYYTTGWSFLGSNTCYVPVSYYTDYFTCSSI